MKKEEIRDVLDRFMNGETTLEEERMLGAFFRESGHLKWVSGSEEVAPLSPEGGILMREEWETYRAMFDYFDRGMVDEAADTTAALVARSRRLARHWLSAAAVAVLIIVCAVAWLSVPQEGTELAQVQPAVADTLGHNAIQTELASAKPETTTVAGGSAGLTPVSNLPHSHRSTARVAATPTPRNQETSAQEQSTMPTELAEGYAQGREQMRQEMRNSCVETLYLMLPDDEEQLQLVMDETGDYQIVDVAARREAAPPPRIDCPRSPNHAPRTTIKNV